MPRKKSTDKRVTSMRISEYTAAQIEQLEELRQATKSEIMMMAVDRMYRQDFPDRKNPMNYQQETQNMNKQQAQQIMKEMEERGINDVQLFHYGPGDYSISGQDPIDGGRFTVHTLENWENRKRDAEIDWNWRDKT